MDTRRSAIAIVAAVTAATVLLAASIGPAGASALVRSMFSCAQSAPCLSWQNTKSGDAVKGMSTNGSALHGQTTFNSNGQPAGKAGVLGEDLSTSGTLSAGVSGVSTNGAGVLGVSTSYNAVEGLSTNSTGAYGQTGAAGGFGFAGRTTSSTIGSGSAVLGDGGANSGIFADASAGTALYGYSETGHAALLFQGFNNNKPELEIQANTATRNLIDAKDITNRVIFTVPYSGSMSVSSVRTGALLQNAPGNYQNPPLIAQGGGVGSDWAVFGVDDSDFNDVFAVTDIGVLAINGLFYTNGPCRDGCLTGRKRVRNVTEYTPLASEPTIEDFGHGTLADGRADIAIDPRFGNVIDPAKRYFVLLEPDDDCRGLYLAEESPKGFTVAESQGGRSHVGFEYRIVAKRFGASAPRLPMTAVQHFVKQGRGGRP